ncbi:hypothetical protein NX059_000421 [Plenodomus lindquistii]|nr:hypothetical protein NX059_000421 [Plenodomus lindquistii]
MNSGSHALAYHWNYAGFPNCQRTQPIQHTLTSPLEIRKLYSEQDLLENNLANCVTYLQALRRKQDRNDGRLSTESAMSRKKRKQIQHNNRELKREILIREQEESTLLSNLQACKAKLYVAESLSSPSAGIPSLVPAFTSDSSRCSILEESEPTEISWNGWADDAVMSPFTKRNQNQFFDAEVAPEECSAKRVEEEVTDNVEVHDVRATVVDGLGIVIPFAPPGTKSSHALLSNLSPEAVIFEPRMISRVQDDSSSALQVEPYNPTSIEVLPHLKEAQQRRATNSATDACHPVMSLQLKPWSMFARNYTWCNNTPQSSPAKDWQGKPLIARKRTASM